MTALNKAPKKGRDWTADEVLQAVRAAGWTIRALAKHHHVSHTTLDRARYMSYPRGEARIAEALGLHPAEIWPSRYEDGQPKRRRPRALPPVIPNLRPGATHPTRATQDTPAAVPAAVKGRGPNRHG